MKDALIVSLLSVVPKSRAARVMGGMARLRLPGWLHRRLVGWFVRKYRVDLSECEGTLQDYPTLAQLFVRPLRPGLRPVDSRPEVLVSPVDARVHTMGRIQDGCFEQAPGVKARVADLLGQERFQETDSQMPAPARFEGGAYAVLYLSPRDYHRVHVPLACRIATWRYLPGTLWPVFPAATRKIEQLFARNERLVFHLETEAGAICEVMVGAFGVGRMTTVLDDEATNSAGGPYEARLEAARSLDRAEELGRFELGSTVILLAEPGRLTWTVQPGEAVRLGRPIAQVHAPTA